MSASTQLSGSAVQPAPAFALVDCNNFYASCEKLFRPDLAHKAVVVLSNNDGCVVARCPLAKQLGIRMGIPAFQLQALLQSGAVVAFSSNYALYADMSARVMKTLAELAPGIEVYSIDEAFLDLSGLAAAERLRLAQLIRQRIRQWLGLTVCVGIAPSKTLAKLANAAAKQYPATAGVVDLTEPSRQQKLLALSPVGEVWGIGQKLSQRLQTLDIHTALQLATADAGWIRQQFSVVEQRIVQELNGQSCLQLDELPQPKQQIISSRSFGTVICQRQQMSEALSEYISRACQKLRQEQQQACQLTVFLRTSPFARQPYYADSRTGRLALPSCDTRDFLQLMPALLAAIWRDGHRYSKAGVMLTDFYPAAVLQPDLFAAESSAERSGRGSQLMQVLDLINHSGRGKVWFAGQGIQQQWQMKRQWLSPAYTTNWQQLAWVR
jgi:DNA polymerase V